MLTPWDIFKSMLYGALTGMVIVLISLVPIAVANYIFHNFKGF
jgi:hypothetical protein